ncbi:hypothetical protein GUITHDRAFT_104174 [Guillardia theta CCMP2712]|uniref:DUF2723 domain-containing protein n=1 Tax=Guillardia theta (strain CCMP2712) TaxID=905079 RepID=L1JP61_GUITC|nr:hypothetical protein GUITHDRAFT_104174 [Guillardia theta CCMP2712]EKX50366.1 hypothetical protein GUITHDRAFT_104174 [Guillardia theta CCMP2712]|eukprot:XP_005837346.1 hypothetical protein GUITHDRAFT_104174 [Guillardia theta CCMP2712]
MPAWKGDDGEEEQEEQEQEQEGSSDRNSLTSPVTPLTPSHQHGEWEDAGEAITPSEDRDGFGMYRHPAVDMEGGRMQAAITSFLILSVYYRTLSPSISGGDSGEVMAAACSGGPAHPPGYPLFVLLARGAMSLFASLGENKAYRVNLMCAMLTAAGVYHLHRAARVMTGSDSSATLASAMYGLSPLIWNNALQAEVFALNNFFVCLLTNLLVRYLARDRPSATRVAFTGAFVVGLGLTNQHTLVLYFKFCPQFEHVPQYSWGDRRSFQGFLNHFLRKDYGTFVLAAGGTEVHGKPVSLLEGIRFYLEDIAGPRLDERRRGHTKTYEGQLMYIGIPFAVVGLILCLYGRPLQRNLAAGRVLVICYLFYIIVFHSLANLPIKVPLFLAVHARFWQMPNSTLFLFVGIGFEFLSRRFADKAFALSVRWAIVCLCVWLQFVKNFDKQDQSGNYAVEFVTRTAIETLPPNAILLCSGDLQFNPGLYLTVCENVRPDVRFMSLQLMSYRWYGLNSSIKWPGVVFPGRSHWPDKYGYSLQKFYDANIWDRPIHSYGGNRPAENLEKLLEDPSLNEDQFFHFTWGLTDRMIPTQVEKINIHQYARCHAKAFAPMEEWEKNGSLPDLLKYGEDTWEDQVVREFYITYHRFGHQLMEYYRTLPGETCGGACPEGCDCDYSMGTTLALARHSYQKLGDAYNNYTAWGLEVPFNWDGAVHQNLGTIDEYEGNAAEGEEGPGG